MIDLENLKIWEEFARSNRHLLDRGDEDWPAHKILLQRATEHADESPVTIAAEKWLEEGECDWYWLRNVWRPKTNIDSPLLNVLEGELLSLIGKSNAVVRQSNAEIYIIDFNANETTKVGLDNDDFILLKVISEEVLLFLYRNKLVKYRIKSKETYTQENSSFVTGKCIIVSFNEQWVLVQYDDFKEGSIKAFDLEGKEINRDLAMILSSYPCEADYRKYQDHAPSEFYLENGMAVRNKSDSNDDFTNSWRWIDIFTSWKRSIESDPWTHENALKTIRNATVKWADGSVLCLSNGEYQIFYLDQKDVRCLGAYSVVFKLEKGCYLVQTKDNTIHLLKCDNGSLKEIWCKQISSVLIEISIAGESLLGLCKGDIVFHTTLIPTSPVFYLDIKRTHNVRRIFALESDLVIISNENGFEVWSISLDFTTFIGANDDLGYILSGASIVANSKLLTWSEDHVVRLWNLDSFKDYYNTRSAKDYDFSLYNSHLNILPNGVKKVEYDLSDDIEIKEMIALVHEDRDKCTAQGEIVQFVKFYNYALIWSGVNTVGIRDQTIHLWDLINRECIFEYEIETDQTLANATHAYLIDRVEDTDYTEEKLPIFWNEYDGVLEIPRYNSTLIDSGIRDVYIIEDKIYIVGKGNEVLVYFWDTNDVCSYNYKNLWQEDIFSDWVQNDISDSRKFGKFLAISNSLISKEMGNIYWMGVGQWNIECITDAGITLKSGTAEIHAVLCKGSGLIRIDDV
jgi:hypothetical protein